MRAALGLLLLLAASPAAAEPGRVLWVGWDAADARVAVPHQAAGGLPALSRVGPAQELTITACRTETKPGWVEQATGHACGTTGVQSNKVYRKLPKGVTIWEQVQAAGGFAGAVSDKCSDPNAGGGNLCFGGTAGHPFERVRPDYLFQSHAPPETIRDRCREALAQAQAAAPPALVFCHWGDVDQAAHSVGSGHPGFVTALEVVDRMLGDLLDGLPAGWAVVVTSDHGATGLPEDARLWVGWSCPKSWTTRGCTPSRLGASAEPPGHLRGPHGLIAASVPLRARTLGIDVFKTLMALLGLPLPANDPRPEGQSALAP